MDGKYLVINSGSSSVKFSLYEELSKKVIASGNLEKIGHSDCSWIIKTSQGKIKNARFLANHLEAIRVIFDELITHHIIEDINEIKGVGHRILHGGSLYSSSVIINDKVLKDIINLTILGPLHHPSQIAGIECIMELLPNVPNVAVFDTAFHQTMPRDIYMYATPMEYYEKYSVRRYGFHGTSHQYITDYTKKLFNRDNINLIICHVGSGVSITAIKNGVSYDTSMGFTPLDGVMMGTRSGSIDPSIIGYIKNVTGKETDSIIRELNENSGLFGIGGKNDYRDIERLVLEGNKEGKLALQMFINSIVKYIAQYYFELDGVLDGLVFTAGIGENSANFRRLVIEKIQKTMGIVIDTNKNEEIAGFKDKTTGIITESNSKVKVFVVPTDEERIIMEKTYKLVEQEKKNNSFTKSE